MTRRRFQMAILAAIALLGALSIAAPVSAHEQRDIGESAQFHVVVGFLNEPAVQGELNAISVRITRNDPSATPAAEDEAIEREAVEGVQGALTFEIIYEDQTAELPVEAVWRDPGHYVAYVIPTQPGVYSFRISGEIDGVAFEEVFTGGPETFSEVAPREELEFPANG
ncbi:MAG: hypothetical protein IT335_12805 [Thermomicrobiales bacterium]|jgi:hypothetical protein|nr:hypothetical protein [Thermomicrobiales bacterium]